MRSFAIFNFVLIFACTCLAGAEPEELLAARKQFAQLPNPTEADRQAHISALAKLRMAFADENSSDDCFAVDAEISRHPAPENSETYRKLMVGQWSSPRHEYVYREDGTWSMLPEEEGITHGRWRIEGNQFFTSVASEPKETSRYTILLLTKDDFLLTDGSTVFYMQRIQD